MKRMSRKEMEFRLRLFEQYAFQDQQKYYIKKKEQYRKAASQASQCAAVLSFLAALAAAINMLLAALSGNDPAVFVIAMICVATAAPVLAGMFNALADLYQWDKQAKIYEDSLVSLVQAEGNMPVPQTESPDQFRGRMMAFGESTLAVMDDETNQWGQLTHAPTDVEKFIEKATERAANKG